MDDTGVVLPHLVTLLLQSVEGRDEAEGPDVREEGEGLDGCETAEGCEEAEGCEGAERALATLRDFEGAKATLGDFRVALATPGDIAGLFFTDFAGVLPALDFLFVPGEDFVPVETCNET